MPRWVEFKGFKFDTTKLTVVQRSKVSMDEVFSTPLMTGEILNSKNIFSPLTWAGMTAQDCARRCIIGTVMISIVYGSPAPGSPNNWAAIVG
jgi:hypothetical protein